jgi:hypothetical protein
MRIKRESTRKQKVEELIKFLENMSSDEIVYYESEDSNGFIMLTDEGYLDVYSDSDIPVHYDHYDDLKTEVYNWGYNYLNFEVINSNRLVMEIER